MKCIEKETHEIKEWKEISSELIAIRQSTDEYDDYTLFDYAEEYYDGVSVYSIRKSGNGHWDVWLWVNGDVHAITIDDSELADRYYDDELDNEGIVILYEQYLREK